MYSKTGLFKAYFWPKITLKYPHLGHYGRAVMLKKRLFKALFEPKLKPWRPYGSPRLPKNASKLDIFGLKPEKSPILQNRRFLRKILQKNRHFRQFLEGTLLGAVELRSLHHGTCRRIFCSYRPTTANFSKIRDWSGRFRPFFNGRYLPLSTCELFRTRSARKMPKNRHFWRFLAT